jgi:hypothetical protein
MAPFFPVMHTISQIYKVRDEIQRKDEPLACFSLLGAQVLLQSLHANQRELYHLLNETLIAALLTALTDLSYILPDSPAKAWIKPNSDWLRGLHPTAQYSDSECRMIHAWSNLLSYSHIRCATKRFNAKHVVQRDLKTLTEVMDLWRLCNEQITFNLAHCIIGALTLVSRFFPNLMARSLSLAAVVFSLTTPAFQPAYGHPLLTPGQFYWAPRQTEPTEPTEPTGPTGPTDSDEYQPLPQPAPEPKTAPESCAQLPEEEQTVATVASPGRDPSPSGDPSGDPRRGPTKDVYPFPDAVVSTTVDAAQDEVIIISAVSTPVETPFEVGEEELLANKKQTETDTQPVIEDIAPSNEPLTAAEEEKCSSRQTEAERDAEFKNDMSLVKTQTSPQPSVKTKSKRKPKSKRQQQQHPDEIDRIVSNLNKNSHPRAGNSSVSVRNRLASRRVFELRVLSGCQDPKTHRTVKYKECTDVGPNQARVFVSGVCLKLLLFTKQPEINNNYHVAWGLWCDMTGPARKKQLIQWTAAYDETRNNKQDELIKCVTSQKDPLSWMFDICISCACFGHSPTCAVVLFRQLSLEHSLALESDPLNELQIYPLLGLGLGFNFKDQVHDKKNREQTTQSFFLLQVLWSPP